MTQPKPVVCVVSQDAHRAAELGSTLRGIETHACVVAESVASLDQCRKDRKVVVAL